MKIAVKIYKTVIIDIIMHSWNIACQEKKFDYLITTPEKVTLNNMIAVAYVTRLSSSPTIT